MVTQRPQAALREISEECFNPTVFNTVCKPISHLWSAINHSEHSILKKFKFLTTVKFGLKLPVYIF